MQSRTPSWPTPKPLPPSPSPNRPLSPSSSPRRISPAPGTRPPPSPTLSDHQHPRSNPKTRARDLLRKHYGLGIGPPPPLPGRPKDPMDIDSSAFDAKAYYEQLITTSSLQALLKRENELSAEIRQLDGERQALIYNHHHELIAATDTIRAMKDRAESLDVDLEKLKVAFSEISRLGAVVSVESHQERINGGNNSEEIPSEAEH